MVRSIGWLVLPGRLARPFPASLDVGLRVYTLMSMGVDLSLCRQCHCLAARKKARAITRHFEAHLRRHGLRATQFSILAVLALAGPKRMGELAKLLDLERTTLTRIAALLEDKGWLEHGPSEDARERVLRITPSGRRKLESAYPSWKEAQDTVAKKFENNSLATAGR